MKQNRRPQRKGRLGDEQRRLLPVVIVPLIVIILMIIIVVADRSKEKNGENGMGSTQSTESSVAPETMGSDETDVTGTGAGGSQAETAESPAETEPVETEPADAYATDTFRRDSIPEILELMKTYFNARAAADAETMNRIYGVGEVSAAELEAEKTRMRSNAKYVQGFENVTTYVMDGTTADAWLVYSIADIRFLSVKTPAPMIMWCYVRKDGEGNYLIQDTAGLSENVLQFIDVANHSEEVRRLASNVNVRLKEALTADEELNSVYGILRDGSPVWQNENDEPEVIIGGSEPAGESESEPSGEPAAETTEGAETTAAATEAETQVQITP